MSTKSRPTLRRVLDEPSSYLLWPRAALMQLAHPSIAPTEVESGAYANRGAQRWRATIDYLRLVAEGDDDTLDRLVREVNRIHATVSVPERRAGGGPRRPVFDSDGQRWVAATWFHSMIETYRLLISDIDDDVLDRLLADFARVGGLLQMDVSDWPEDYARFTEFVRCGELSYPVMLPRSEPDAPPEQLLPGDVAASVFSAYSLPLRYVRWAPKVRLVTWGMAGPVLRGVYGIEWSDEHQARFEHQARRWRRLLALWPGALRRRNGRKGRRKAAQRLREHQARSYTETKAHERRLAAERPR
ncbi:oxygenase MpaB family protein [Gordonia sp. (in: high G+C Gram-positive bacteria)]|uniref:oxygenase MpaB family protein n=1 Tax=Gordonia sp. (in: high G+C Gram-positive bacteria) TaxID=84139 RepID=UPI0035275F2C